MPTEAPMRIRDIIKAAGEIKKLYADFSDVFRTDKAFWTRLRAPNAAFGGVTPERTIELGHPEKVRALLASAGELS